MVRENEVNYSSLMLAKAVISAQTDLGSYTEEQLLCTNSPTNQVTPTIAQLITAPYQVGTAVEAIFSHFPSIIEDIRQNIVLLIPQSDADISKDVLKKLKLYRTLLDKYKSEKNMDTYTEMNPLIFAVAACAGITHDMANNSDNGTGRTYISLPTAKEYNEKVKGMCYCTGDEAYNRILKSAEDLMRRFNHKNRGHYSYQVLTFGDRAKNEYIYGLFLLESLIREGGYIDTLLGEGKYLDVAAMIAIFENNFISPYAFAGMGLYSETYEDRFNDLIDYIDDLPLHDTVYQTWLDATILTRVMCSVFNNTNVDSYIKRKNG